MSGINLDDVLQMAEASSDEEKQSAMIVGLRVLADIALAGLELTREEQLQVVNAISRLYSRGQWAAISEYVELT